MHAILLGPPGAGKGTQAELLCRERAMLHLSTGDLLRDAVREGTELGREAQAYMDRGELVPDALVLALLRERLQRAEAEPGAEGGFLLDGFPRNLAQARALEEELGADAIERVVYLDLADEEILARLVKRGRPDDTVEVIRNRLDVYRAETEPLVAFYRQKSLLRRADAKGTVEEVRARVREALGEPDGVGSEDDGGARKEVKHGP